MKRESEGDRGDGGRRRETRLFERRPVTVEARKNRGEECVSEILQVRGRDAGPVGRLDQRFIGRVAERSARPCASASARWNARPKCIVADGLGSSITIRGRCSADAGRGRRNDETKQEDKDGREGKWERG